MLNRRLGLLSSLLAALLLTACQPVRAAPPLAVTLTRAADRADLRWEGRDLVIDLHSAGGIGGAHLTWRGDLGAETLLLRLHLGGLEGLHVTTPSGAASLSVLSSPPYTVRSEGDAGGVTGITVARSAGGFSVRLDRTWLQGGSLDVEWVDFYR